METTFASLLQRYGIDSQTIANSWQNLVCHYQQPHRHYHNLSHIGALLTHFDKVKSDRVKSQLKHPDSVLLAIFYHDVIYQTQGKQASSNERQSADFFIAELGNFLPIDMQNRVVALILATEKHELADKSDSDMAYVLDMDLSILGKPEPIYQQYCQQIRLEYQHVAKIFYNFGRKKALQRFLNRQRLYFTDDFYQPYEQQARQNIANEIKTLKLLV